MLSPNGLLREGHLASYVLTLIYGITKWVCDTLTLIYIQMYRDRNGPAHYLARVGVLGTQLSLMSGMNAQVRNLPENNHMGCAFIRRV